MATNVVATRVFTYAGTQRFVGEVFELGGHIGDAGLLAVGYVGEHIAAPEADEVEDDDGRTFVSAAHRDRARVDAAQMGQEERERVEGRRDHEARAAARDARLAEERRVHGAVWYCPQASGGCGLPYNVGEIEKHISGHHSPERNRIEREHQAQHEENIDRSLPVRGNPLT